MMKYLIVGFGGFFGSVLRYWVGVSTVNRWGTKFPYGTFLVNLTGSFLVGLSLTLLAERTDWNPNLRYLIPIGFIGGYTTFSAFEYETFRSVQDGRVLIAALNVVLSVVLGYLGVWSGVIAAKTMA